MRYPPGALELKETKNVGVGAVPETKPISYVEDLISQIYYMLDGYHTLVSDLEKSLYPVLTVERTYVESIPIEDKSDRHPNLADKLVDISNSIRYSNERLNNLRKDLII